jgi:tetratricopeptide (TPR) repeat protein
MKYTADSLFEQGIEQHQEGQLEAAIATYSQAIAQRPNYAEALYNRALAYLELEDRAAEALADLNAAIEHQPQFADAYFCRGLMAIDRQQYEAALHDFNRALDFDPFSPSPAINRGAIYCIQKDYAQAQAEYNSAAAVWPDNALLRFNQAIVYAELHGYRTALDIINAIQPDEMAPWPWLLEEIPKLKIDLEASIYWNKHPPGLSYIRQISIAHTLH